MEVGDQHGQRETSQFPNNDYTDVTARRSAVDTPLSPSWSIVRPWQWRSSLRTMFETLLIKLPFQKSDDMGHLVHLEVRTQNMKYHVNLQSQSDALRNCRCKHRHTESIHWPARNPIRQSPTNENGSRFVEPTSPLSRV